jgi:hypothetical protein
MITSTRAEKWGLVAYDRDLDEFEARLFDTSISPVIDRPLSVGCLVTGSVVPTAMETKKLYLRSNSTSGDGATFSSISDRGG